MPETLRPLRFPIGESRGRRYPEPAHPYRSEFQRDRDRIVYARAFRRLENKTQVFAPGLSDHFRNRLTHTIEVSQIARTVANALELEEDLTEALALAHDIGHPPFAHSGEAALDRQMKGFGDRFDHNLHALRIVESFEQRYARFPGLNLSFEVREGIVKHSTDLEEGCEPDLEEYLPGQRPPLEAQLIDLADEIAYNMADLDDAFGANLVTARGICSEVPAFADLYEATETRFPGGEERVRFHETLKLLHDGLVSGLIVGTVQAAASAGVASSNAVRRHPERLARFTDSSGKANRELKTFLHANVYRSQLLLEARKRSEAVIAGLFEHYLGSPERMPEPYSELVRALPPHRVVCDYIAGMTDRFCERTYLVELG